MPAQAGRKIVAIGHGLTPASLAMLAMHGCIDALPNRRPADYLTVRAHRIAGSRIGLLSGAGLSWSVGSPLLSLRRVGVIRVGGAPTKSARWSTSERIEWS